MSENRDQVIDMLRMIDDSIGTLTESVRALKPAPTAMPTWLSNFEPIGPGVAPQPTGSGHTMPAAAELRSLLVSAQAEADRLRSMKVADETEIERLQAKVAADVLTIAALKDENTQLKAACVDWQCSESNLKDDIAELKRFRKREEKVQDLLRLLNQVHMRLPADVNEAWIAVGDFEVTDHE